MQHLIRRCKHCRREYIYCTYGNGEEYGTEAGCSMEYCADCQRAIDEALAKIPVKFGGRRMDITPNEELLMLFKKVKEDQEKQEKEIKEKNGLPIIRAVPFSNICGEYDNCDTCVFDGKTFVIEWNDATPKDVHVTVEMEYDFIEKITENYWRTEHRNSYTHYRPMKVMDLKDVKPMNPPLGNLAYLDFDWNIGTKKETRKPVKIPHEKVTYTRQYNGKVVGEILNKPQHGTKIAYSLDRELYPFMDYDIFYEKYRDEDFETIVDVKLHGL